MSGFSGISPTPISSNNASEIRSKLSVPSTSEMNAAIAQSTASTVVAYNVVQADEGYTFTEQRFSKIGNLAQLYFRVRATNAITGRVRIGVVNQDYRPNRTIRGIAAAASNFDGHLNSAVNFYIKTDGSVTIDIIDGLDAPKELNITASWIV